MIRKLGDGFDFFRLQAEPRRTRQVLRANRRPSAGLKRQRRGARARSGRALSTGAKRKTLFWPRRTPSVSTSWLTSTSARLADMAADGLPFGQSLDPRRRERGGLDAEAGIDHHQTLGKKLCEMLGLAIGARKPDARGLRDIVDANEHQIETPRADAARLQVEAQLLAKRVDDAFQILGIPDRLGKAQFRARHLRRDQGRQRFLLRSQRLIETQQHAVAEAQAQAGARLAGELRDALDADVVQRGYDISGSRSAATGRLAIASEARPGETIPPSP